MVFGPAVHHRQGEFTNRGLGPFAMLFHEVLPMHKVFAGWGNGSDRAVLELGCGEGRMCLDLLASYPSATAFCINNLQWGKSRPDYLGNGAATGDTSTAAWEATATHFNLPVPPHWPEVTYTKYGDSNHLPYPDASFDLVLAQHSLNEGKLVRPDYQFPNVACGVVRTLREGGMALLHTVCCIEKPDYFASTARQAVLVQRTRATMAAANTAFHSMRGDETATYGGSAPLAFARVPVGVSSCVDVLLFEKDAGLGANETIPSHAGMNIIVLIQKHRCRLQPGTWQMQHDGSCRLPNVSGASFDKRQLKDTHLYRLEYVKHLLSWMQLMQLNVIA
mmetsp:Transcript_36896/g.61127  ORF Transcript_36896/g.61127 Transcript_36896/m.61127 type:complete len:334 (+) Transcript_36896:132-1133(+)|eukprot:CAMPEP_0119303990 /NCGR_PEP_ID=MMETSP1333-20130426/5323_1 /TAXON_ID=418940 /ORGANISM="Scyphosphaera apsteinii, Strain RCC1455" /LENGTH=333 /DNA_ID=CAMNT_0007306787 /DNA_START=126 /DNA_END=1127 /DNA_ORIENTATION=-